MIISTITIPDEKVELIFKNSAYDVVKNMSLDRKRREIFTKNSVFEYELKIQNYDYKSAAIFYTKLIDLYEKGTDIVFENCDLTLLRMFFPNNDDTTAISAEGIDLYFEFDLQEIETEEKNTYVNFTIPIKFAGNVG